MKRRCCRNIFLLLHGLTLYIYTLYTISNVVARERDREKLKYWKEVEVKERNSLRNNYMCVCVCGWVSRVGRSVTDQPWNPGLGSPLSGLIIRGSTRESLEKFLPANFPSPTRSTEIIKYDAKLLPFFLKREPPRFRNWEEFRRGNLSIKSPFKTKL